MGVKNLTPEQLSQLVELLPHSFSLREIARKMDERQDAIRMAAQPLIAIMNAQGVLAPCLCGKPRFHPFGCSVRMRDTWPADRFPARTVSETAVLLAKRQAVIEALVGGLRLCEVNQQMGFRHKDARHYLRFLTPEQFALREKRLTARGLPPGRPHRDAPQENEL